MANYRKMFKEHYGIEFGPEYVVHHIDMDRENNEISNLMLLPAKLHASYHSALKGCCCDKTKTTVDLTVRNSFCNGVGCLMEEIEKALPIYAECCVWYDYKRYLDGDLPNIHNIEL